LKGPLTPKSHKSQALRSWMMSRVRGKNTGLELQVRRALRRAGYRFKSYSKSLRGNPDVVLPSFKRVVFVHGCFWHSHHCKRGVRPKSNLAFWTKKLDANKKRDRATQAALRRAGWKVSVIWQCTLKQGIARLLRSLAKQATTTS